MTRPYISFPIRPVGGDLHGVAWFWAQHVAPSGALDGILIRADLVRGKPCMVSQVVK